MSTPAADAAQGDSTGRGSPAGCRDPKDDKFLELAVSGKADVIVSGATAICSRSIPFATCRSSRQRRSCEA
jgi:PIN domain